MDVMPIVGGCVGRIDAEELPEGHAQLFTDPVEDGNVHGCHGGVLVLALIGQPVAIQPLYVSKLNTMLQIVLVAASLFMAGFGLDHSQFAGAHFVQADLIKAVLIWAVGVTTLASGGAYVWNAVRTR